MPLLRPLDPAFPLDRQLAVDATPVVLVNLVTLDKADEPRFLEAWQHDAAFMKRQPGFISTQLHRAIGDSPTYSELRGVGVDGPLPHRLHASRVQGRPRRVSVLRGRHPAPLSDGRRARHLCGLEGKGNLVSLVAGICLIVWLSLVAAVSPQCCRHRT